MYDLAMIFPRENEKCIIFRDSKTVLLDLLPPKM